MKIMLAIVALGFFSLACTVEAVPLQLHSQMDSSFTPSASAGGDSVRPILSSDGRFILFASTANNLALAATNAPYRSPVSPCFNVYLRDRASNTTALVSVSPDGTSGADHDAMPAGISGDGRFVLFQSTAGNLVAGGTNNYSKVLVRDLLNGTNSLVSVNTNGLNGIGDSFSAVMTPDGRYVAFASGAPDLVTNDRNGLVDVFIRDLQIGTTVCVSQGSQSAGTNIVSRSDAPAITPDGRYVAFYSSATNLVADQPLTGEVYLRDMVAGTTTWVSGQARSQYQALMGNTNASSCAAAISDDGNYIAFETFTNTPSATAARGVIFRYNRDTGETIPVNTNACVPLLPFENVPPITMTSDGRFIASAANIQGLAGTNTAIYLWDAQTAGSTLISADTNGGLPAAAFCGSPCVSTDGQYVAFVSTSPTLNTNAVGNGSHLYLRDVAAGITSLLDTNTNGVSAGDNLVSATCLSLDGRLAAFDSLSADLVANDGNQKSDVFLRDTRSGAIELISVRQAQLPSIAADGYYSFSTQPLSRDGHYLAFVSDADNLVPGATNKISNCFVRDVYSGTTRLISVGLNGKAASGASYEPAISGNGRYVAFTSAATNLIARDANRFLDVFLCNLQSNTISLVSANRSGTGGGYGDSYSPQISADGRFILFLSTAHDLGGNWFGGKENLFLRDVQMGTNYALTTHGQTAYAMTPDGHYIAFIDSSAASSGTVFIWNSQSARVSTNSSRLSGIKSLGISPDGRRVACYAPDISSLSIIDRSSNTAWVASSVRGPRPGLRFSADGNFLVYADSSRNWPTNQIYLCNVAAHTTVAVSWNSPYVLGNGSSDSPDISADGRFVVYRSFANNLIRGSTNRPGGIYLFDVQTGTNVLLSASANGDPANSHSFMPLFSSDGHTLVFRTWANNLVPGDFNQGANLVVYAFLYANIGSDPAGGLTIDWPTAPGQTFGVQYKDDLADPVWHAFSGTFHTNGNRASLTDATATSDHRFYRVVSDK